MKKKHFLVACLGMFVLGGVLMTAHPVSAIAGYRTDSEGNRLTYEDNSSPHIIFNVVGVDDQKRELYPHYVRINVAPGQHLSKEDLLKHISQNLNNSVGGAQTNGLAFEAVDFIGEPCLEYVTQDNKGEDDQVSRIEITNEGVDIPSDKQFGYKLHFTCKAIVKYRLVEAAPITYELFSGNVRVIHEIRFVDSQTGESLNNVRFVSGMQTEAVRRAGDIISSDELEYNARVAFDQTRLAYYGYRLQHRMSTQISQNGQLTDSVYEYNVNEDGFQYEIKKYRPQLQEGQEQLDYIYDTYYISQDGQDYVKSENQVEIMVRDLNSKQYLKTISLQEKGLASAEAVGNALLADPTLLSDKSNQNYRVTDVYRKDDTHYVAYVTAQ